MVYQTRFWILLLISFVSETIDCFEWTNPWDSTEAGVSQGSILGPLLILINVNDLSDNLSTTAKLFVDDTSLFSIVQNINTSVCHLNSDLSKIRY